MAEAKQAPAKKVVKKKKGKRKVVTQGRVYILASYNNTIISFTDQNGNLLAQGSAGKLGFKGPKKATPYAAGLIIKNLVDKVKEMGLKDLAVYIKGIGSGRDGALRGLTAAGFSINSIKDITPIPHNGCRPKKPRRV
jgi:small subunit ribosomal protein S11